MSGQRLSLDMLPQDVPREVQSLIIVCWDQEAMNRPAFTEITAPLHQFVYGPLKVTEIENAIETVLSTYYKRFGSSNVSDLAQSDHREKIKRVHQTLCEFIRHPDEILSSLFQKRAVTQQERESIRSQTNIYEWTSRLLDVILVKPADAYKHFLEALDATKQHRLYLLLENKDYKLNVDHKTTLIDNFTYLRDNIALSDSALLDTLQVVGVLDQREVDEIRSKNTEHERIDQLLQYILRTSQEQYQQFLEALNKTSHQHVRKTLEGENSSGIRVREELEKSELLTNSLSNLSIVHVMPSTGKEVNGLTVLGRQLFVLRWSPEVYVYTNTDSFTPSPSIMFPDSQELDAIVSCAYHNCLSLIDTNQEKIYRYDILDKTTTSWSLNGKCPELSVTNGYNVLVILRATKCIQEYTTDGCLIREITIDHEQAVARSVLRPCHCVQLSTGDFVVCFQGSVCVVDLQGYILHSYDASGHVQRYSPRHVTVDRHDNVLVTDYSNNKVTLLSSTLSYRGDLDVELPGQRFNEPHALHIDELNNRLYVGELDGGRIFVLDVNINNIGR